MGGQEPKLTLGATLEANNFPTLVSDFLVTADEYSKFRHVPSTSLKDIVEYSLAPADYVGKTVLLDASTIISFAGCAQQIESFFSDFRFNFARKPENYGPMQWASQLVNEFNVNLSEDDQISVVGFSVGRVPGSSENSDRVVNWIARYSSRFTSKKFGLVQVMGTGRDDFLAALKEFDDRHYIEGGAPDTSFDLICWLGTLNSQKIFNPKVGGRSDTWGGYVQSFTYGVTDDRWYPTPNWIQLAYKLDLNANPVRFGVLLKCVLFQGGLINSFLVTCYLGDEPQYYIDKVSNYLPSLYVPQSQDSGRFDFANFKPRFATVAFDVRCSQKRWFRHSNLIGPDIENLILDITHDGIQKLGLSSAYLGQVAREELQAFQSGSVDLV